MIGARRLDHLVEGCTGRTLDPSAVGARLDVDEVAGRVVRTIAEQRSTWTVWNVHAETERALRPYRFADDQERESVTAAVVGRATAPDRSIRITEPELVRETPELVRNSDGVSVFSPHGSDRFTTSEVLIAEDELVAAVRSTDGPHLNPGSLKAALAIHEARTGLVLDRGQRGLVEAFACSPARIVVGIGPAGAGKTTAMRAFAAAWQANTNAGGSPGAGGRVVPLATSSKAAQVLGGELDVRAENLHKFLFENQRPGGPTDSWFRLGRGDVVLLDEAGMAGTLHLHQLLRLATGAGATVRLLGDPAQLAAVDAGGALNLLDQEVGATYLTTLHRFTDPAEGEATLALRRGNPDAIAFYDDRNRITAGSRDAMLETAYDHWASDIWSGKTSVLIAATTADVAALNARARLERALAGQVEADGVVLHDGNLAGAGDWIVTRANARTLRYGQHWSRRKSARWVHNGDTWQVTRRHRDGSLTVRPLDHHSRSRVSVRLPAEYVSESVELGYACTAHRAQGATVDTAHALVTTEMTREGLYVASTRGRDSNRWYVASDDPASLDCEHEPEPPRTVTEVLDAVLHRTGAELSATQTIRAVTDEAVNLHTLVARYEHAYDRAAMDALRLAVSTWPQPEQHRLLHDNAAPRLARVLADATGRGAHGPEVLGRALDLDTLENTGSPALVLASRITDHPRTLGIPDEPPDQRPEVQHRNRPVPWLPAPATGHGGWDGYLRMRAALIEQRAEQLGSLVEAYLEQYDIQPTTTRPLGDPPQPGTRREGAYSAAVAELTTTPPRPAPAQPGTPARTATRPPAPQPTRQQSHQLSR